MARRFLGTDFTDPEVIPYFTWDAPMIVRAIREQLASAPAADRLCQARSSSPKRIGPTTRRRDELRACPAGSYC